MNYLFHTHATNCRISGYRGNHDAERAVKTGSKLSSRIIQDIDGSGMDITVYRDRGFARCRECMQWLDMKSRSNVSWKIINEQPRRRRAGNCNQQQAETKRPRNGHLKVLFYPWVD